ncbi:MAG: general secretion pathway protein GspK [Phycisphaerae bacterium]|nr:general secretion pathway protein GspK [Phycisphaerae bacterium]
MVALLALLAAGYTFVVHCNLNTVMGEHYRFQARMAAESGVQRVIVMLRRNPDEQEHVADLDEWYDNPVAFHGAIVYSREGSEGAETFREFAETDTDEDATYDPHAQPVWRFSLIAPNLDEPEKARYGVTDECSKLDLNLATESQLRDLFEMVIPDDAENVIDVNVLVHSLLDWRDGDSTALEYGAEGTYYMSLDPPYQCKSADFSTVEELLMVRGFTGWVVFGEDYNRNGLLDPNEDDGDESFPPDNGDGVLFPGVAAFLTVWSREMNTSNDNRPRINLNMQDTEKLQEKLEEYLDGSIVSYILDVRASGKAFNSVMNLLPVPPPPEEEEETEGEASPESTQGEGEGATSQPDNENGEASEEDLSDLDQSGSASENVPSSSRPVYQNLTEEEPPCSYDDLPLILDRLTVEVVPMFRGRINVSTAPREVLAMLDELTDEELDALADARPEVTGKEKATPAWLVTQGVLDEYKFRQILDKITTKSSVYRIESVGYADHVGVVERLNVVLEMSGPIAQVLYYRNLRGLGPAYTPHGEERRGLRSRSN